MSKIVRESIFRSPSKEEIKDNIQKRDMYVYIEPELVEKFEPDFLEELIQEGVLSHEQIKSCMDIAAESGYLDKFKVFTKYAKIYRDEKFEPNPFERAAYYGHMDIIKYLIEELQVDPNLNNGEAINDAAYNGHLNILKYLRKHGANLNINNNEPFLLAANEGQLKVVRYLAETTNIDSKTIEYALLRAKSQGKFPQLIDYLKEKVEDYE